MKKGVNSVVMGMVKYSVGNPEELGPVSDDEEFYPDGPLGSFVMSTISGVYT